MLQYTWNDFTVDARVIAAAIKRSGRRFSAIYAIPRGGLVLGVYLSHTLNLPMIVAPELSPLIAAFDMLVVDDNTVTGSALAEFKDCATAVLVHNAIGSAVTPTFFGRESLNWPVFPWEQDSGIAPFTKGVAA